ncbi:hypothetical protein E2C01_050219 [Portunus trituberculatus]|uniref:Secreted protein n=1 Tax=Portunus trituberculatus TaxID=210409 RepID=A0A5B7GFA7_PORTR|nr:hypothetical protein [Portunus trituberculatus]
MIFCGDGLLYFFLVSSGVLGNCTNTEHAEAQGRQRNGRGVRTWTAIVAKYSCSSTNTKNSVKEEKAGWHSRTYQTTHGFPREDYRDCVVSTMIAEVSDVTGCDVAVSLPWKKSAARQFQGRVHDGDPLRHLEWREGKRPSIRVWWLRCPSVQRSLTQTKKLRVRYTAEETRTPPPDNEMVIGV